MYRYEYTVEYKVKERIISARELPYTTLIKS